MPDDVQRAQQLELLQPLRSISTQGARGLAMLTRGVALAGSTDDGDDDSSVTGSLISYCVRDALDAIFPKLDDPRISHAAQRIIRDWRKLTAGSGTDLSTALQDDFEELERAVEAATSGFLPRVSGLIGVLYPGLPANTGIPAMSKLRDLNREANDGLHGSTTRDAAVALLDRTLERLVDLIAPLAVTSAQYQSLVEAGDFQGVSALLATNSDPRIRVYLFDHVRGPLLAQALDVEELLPGPTLWLAYGYVRHLAADHPTEFSGFVDRVVAANRLSPEVAGQLLICASFAGAHAAAEVNRLSQRAGSLMRVELIARWLQGHVDAAPKETWWKVLTRLVDSLDPSTRTFQPAYGVAELVDLAIARLPGVALKTESRFSSAIIAALARLEAESTYAVQFHFDNRHRRARTMSDLLIGAAVRIIALAESRGAIVDLTALEDRNRALLERAAAARAITMASPDLAAAIAGRAFDAVIARISGDEWPDSTDQEVLEEILRPIGPAAVGRIAAALGEPPQVDILASDLDNAADERADWFRTAQWAGYLPEAARPGSWVDALHESAARGIIFGPLPPPDRMARPTAHESPLGDVDIPNTTVPELVLRVNGALGVGEPDDPRFAMNLQETVANHVGTHREAWASDHASIGQVHDLWVRLAIVRALKSEANDAPRLRWEQLQALWTQLISETSTLHADGVEAAKSAMSRLAAEVLDQLRHRVAERPRQPSDIDWWATDVLPPLIPMLAWIGGEEHDFGMPALFSLRGEAVHLLVALSSPIDDDTARDAALGRALDLLAEAAAADARFARSVGYWARWLIRRDPAWWDRCAVHLIGTDSTPEIHQALLTANWESDDFAFTLLDRDVPLLNSFASQQAEDAAAPALTAVLFGVLPIAAIEESTWSAIFRDRHSADMALRYLFPDRSIEEDARASRRLEILQWAATGAPRASVIWHSMDSIACSPDVSDEDLFAFTSDLARSNRGAPMSMHHLADRLVRSLASHDAVATLEAMCAGNLGSDRAMAQLDMEPVHAWFRGEGQRLPEDLRRRVQHALFEVGFTDE
ncbi:hypothetical protein [Agromyces ramosus]|uniref:HEAT repeat protein n=1 Tax=Agromyces ramosus TaxID=33879 RepID=A0ABU0RCK0_9MICO|nr:hypothetical protein [Agromyces ramosus]MDQ0895780.1 hypothetical protein [Agromyces ramosus]